MKRKPLIYCVMFLLTSMFYGCNKESDNILSDKANILTENKTIQGVISESEFPYIMQNNKTISDDEIQLKSAGVWDGPYYKKGNVTKIQSNSKMIIYSGQIPGIASGIYFCDIYSISVTVNLPANTIANVFIPNPCGFSNYNTKVIGVNYTQSISSSGTALYMQTYTLVVKYNLSGQTIGKAWPCNANNIIFSYSTMTY